MTSKNDQKNVEYILPLLLLLLLLPLLLSLLLLLLSLSLFPLEIDASVFIVSYGLQGRVTSLGKKIWRTTE